MRKASRRGGTGSRQETAAGSLRRQQQVRRLDVTMNEAGLMRVLQAQGRLTSEVERLGDRQRPVPLNAARQVDAVDVLHLDEMLSIADVRIECADQVGTRLKRAKNRHLALKPFDDLRVFEAF